MSDKKVMEYRDEPRCKVCSARDKDGRRVRDEIDAFVAKGHTYKQTIAMMEENYGISPSINSLSNHFTRHSPFVRKAKETIASKSGRKLRARIEKNMVESSQAIQKIIDIGDAMVDNWANDRKGPKLPVTERLYIEALKEQGRRGTKTTIDVELEEMDKSLFEDEEIST